MTGTRLMGRGDEMSDGPSRYRPLVDHLAAVGEGEVVLTFKEIAALIGRRSLPESAILRSGRWRDASDEPVMLRRAAAWDAHPDRDYLRVIFTRVAEEG